MILTLNTESRLIWHTGIQDTVERVARKEARSGNELVEEIPEPNYTCFLHFFAFLNLKGSSYF